MPESMSELTQQEQQDAIVIAQEVLAQNGGQREEHELSHVLSRALLSLHGKLEEAEKEVESVAVILDRLYAPMARSIDGGGKVDTDDLGPMQTCLAELMAVWFRLRPGSSNVGVVRAAAKASERRAQG